MPIGDPSAPMQRRPSFISRVVLFLLGAALVYICALPMTGHRMSGGSIIMAGTPWDAPSAYLAHFTAYFGNAQPIRYVEDSDGLALSLDTSLAKPNRERLRDDKAIDDYFSGFYSNVGRAYEIFQRDPHNFYAAYYLSRYYATKGQDPEADAWFTTAERAAPRLLVGRFEADDGRPVPYAGGTVTVYYLDSVQALPDILDAEEYSITTDSQGRWCIPVANAITAVEVGLPTFSGGTLKSYAAADQNDVNKPFVVAGPIGIVPPLRFRKTVALTINGRPVSSDRNHPTLIQGKKLHLRWPPLLAANYSVTFYYVEAYGNRGLSEESVESHVPDTSQTEATVDVDTAISPPFRHDLEYGVQVVASRDSGSQVGRTKEVYFDLPDAAFPPPANVASVQAGMPPEVVVQSLTVRSNVVRIFGHGPVSAVKLIPTYGQPASPVVISGIALPVDCKGFVRFNTGAINKQGEVPFEVSYNAPDPTASFCQSPTLRGSRPPRLPLR